MPDNAQRAGTKNEGGSIDSAMPLRLQDVLNRCLEGDGPGALKQVLKLVDSGDPDALYVAGAIYEAGGEGLPLDCAKAAFYYRRAMEEAGSIGAWLGTARLHFLGRGVPQDYDEAFRCYLAVAEDSGHPLAWLMLGRMHLEGKGTKKNLIRAREYLNKAASQDYVFAFTFLGYVARESRKPVEALCYFFKASWLAAVTSKHDPKSKMM